MTAAKRIVCYGELLVRLSAPGRERLLQTPRLDVNMAGAEANVAVALSYLGHHASMVSVLPPNALGAAAKGELRRHGVDTTYVTTAPGRMGLFFVAPGAVRRPTEITYDRADSAFATAPEASDLGAALKGADWFHISGVTPALGQKAADAAARAVRLAREKGVAVSFDGNYRSKLWEVWRGDSPSILRAIFEQADIVFGDDRDVALVLGMTFSNPRADERRAEAYDAAFKAFPNLKLVASTIRVQHAVDDHDLAAVMQARGGNAWRVAPVELRSIVDRIGTGDAFAAGVLHGLMTGQGEETALQMGHAAACLKHAIPGDFNLVTEAEIRAAMAGEGLDIRR